VTTLIQKIFAPTVLMLCSGWILAADEPVLVDPTIGLAELAASADVVVLAQVRDTDYLYRREYPVDGSAFLKVLIPYKLDPEQDMIEVFEEGLHAGECYFQNPTVFEEGRRYLLFLRRDSEKPERFRGLAQGCALDVLVDRDNRYILRVPVTGISLADDLNQHTRKFDFADSYAMEDDESLSSEQRQSLISDGLIERRGESWIYTSGVELSIVRKLMWPNTVSPASQAVESPD